MAVRRATRSTRSSSGEATIPSKARPVSLDSAWREATAAVARSAEAMSSGVRPVAWASSDKVGSRPSWAGCSTGSISAEAGARSLRRAQCGYIPAHRTGR